MGMAAYLGNDQRLQYISVKQQEQGLEGETPDEQRVQFDSGCCSADQQLLATVGTSRSSALLLPLLPPYTARTTFRWQLHRC